MFHPLTEPEVGPRSTIMDRIQTQSFSHLFLAKKKLGGKYEKRLHRFRDISVFSAVYLKSDKECDTPHRFMFRFLFPRWRRMSSTDSPATFPFWFQNTKFGRCPVFHFARRIARKGGRGSGVLRSMFLFGHRTTYVYSALIGIGPGILLHHF